MDRGFDLGPCFLCELVCESDLRPNSGLNATPGEPVGSSISPATIVPAAHS